MVINKMTPACVGSVLSRRTLIDSPNPLHRCNVHIHANLRPVLPPARLAACLPAPVPRHSITTTATDVSSSSSLSCSSTTSAATGCFPYSCDMCYNTIILRVLCLVCQVWSAENVQGGRTLRCACKNNIVKVWTVVYSL